MSAHRKDIGVSGRESPNVDKSLKSKYMDQWIRCSKGHLNSPNAEVCWKCGRTIERAISEERTNEHPKERLYESVNS